ncbi:MAG: class I tRNA ligase family protein, partial [Candidatus Parcubacteria bacterium]|nr:class I tRNA ligase family protein [Candidatus Parcubacteria bacterium]
VDPLLLINTYGADATRFGLTWQATGVQDIRFNEEFILSGKKFLNKLWNASRFVILNLKDKVYSDKKPISLKLNKYDKQILTKLGKIIKQTNADLDKERFGQSLQNLYQFFWHDFCDLYLEQSKKSPNPETNQVLYYVLKNCLRLFHPYIPFATEYIWQLLPGKATLLITESWPKVS